MESVHFSPRHFLRDISHPGNSIRHSTWTFSSNKFPPWKIPFPEQTLIILNDVTFAVGLAANPILAKKTRIFCHCIMDLCSARSPKHWQPQCLKQFTKNASSYPICRLCYYNCNSALSGQLCPLLPLWSCRRVRSHVFFGPHLRSLAYIMYRDVQLKNASCWQNRTKRSKEYGK